MGGHLRSHIFYFSAAPIWLPEKLFFDYDFIDVHVLHPNGQSDAFVTPYVDDFR